MRDAIPREELQRLSARRDAPGLVHLVVQLGVFAISAWATAALGAAGHPAWWIAATVCGFAVYSFFPTLHESGHRTAFRSAALNELGVWLGALFMLQAPSFFREFHWEHHRSTQDRERDPEISTAPDLLDGFATNPLYYLALLSGQSLIVAKLGFTTMCALLPVSIWSRFLPYVRADRRRRVAWESRAALALFGSALGLGFALLPGFGFILVAWPLAHLWLGFTLMAEHTGLANDGSQNQRTRTVRSNAAMRWLMWNMPYHAEHHMHPGVPFHALPELHALAAPSLLHQSPGYLHFHGEALRHAFRLAPHRAEPTPGA